MSTEKPLSLVPGRTDRELAEEFRQRLRAALAPAMEIVDDATREGLVVNFVLGRNAFGRCVINDISVTRPL